MEYKYGKKSITVFNTFDISSKIAKRNFLVTDIEFWSSRKSAVNINIVNTCEKGNSNN